MRAESGSGISSMSEASMPFQPAIEEPSNAWPSLNLLSSNILAGTLTCCSLPFVSVKRRSTNLTSFSLIVLNTSPAAAIEFSCGGTVPRFGEGTAGDRRPKRENSEKHATKVHAQLLDASRKTRSALFSMHCGGARPSRAHHHRASRKGLATYY